MLTDRHIEKVKAACLREFDEASTRTIKVVEEFVKFCELLSRPDNIYKVRSGQFIEKQVNVRTEADMAGEVARELTGLPKYTAYAKVLQNGGHKIWKGKIRTLALRGTKKRAADTSETLSHVERRSKIERQIVDRHEALVRCVSGRQGPPPAKASAETRKRKLASIRGFLKFCKDNQIIYGNPADTIGGPIREERDPAILLKTEYKALLQVAGENERDFAIVMLFLQSDLRVSELVNLRLNDVDFESREITVRQGKGRKDRVVPLVGQALEALKVYLAVREVSPEYDNVFLARNKTSMDPRTVRYRIQKHYKEAGIRKKASVHTLRHTFATHQIHNGLKINQLKDVLGHKKMETTYKYVHLDRTNLRREMEAGAL